MAEMFDHISKAIDLTLVGEADYPAEDVSYFDMDTKQVVNNESRINCTEVPFEEQQMVTAETDRSEEMSHNRGTITGVMARNDCRWLHSPVIDNANRMNHSEVPFLFYQQQMGTPQMHHSGAISYNGGMTTGVMGGNDYRCNMDNSPVIDNANRMNHSEVPFLFYQQQMGTPQMHHSGAIFYNGGMTTVMGGNGYRWNMDNSPVINNSNRQQSGPPPMHEAISYNGTATCYLARNDNSWNVNSSPMIDNANRINRTDVPFLSYEQQLGRPPMHRPPINRREAISNNGTATGYLARNDYHWNVDSSPVIKNANRINRTERPIEQQQMGPPDMHTSEAISYNRGTTNGVSAANNYSLPVITDANRMERTEASTKTPNILEQTGGGTIKMYENRPNMDAKPMSNLLRNINPNKRSCDDAKMIVQTSDCSIQEKRYFCIYCKKTCVKLPRHFEDNHSEETEVIRFAGLDKGTKERRNILDSLRKKGMYEWNMNEDYNKGLLLTCRRPNPKQSNEAIGFTSCVMCLGSFRKTSLRHHMKTCTGNAIKGERCVLVLSRAVEGRIHHNASNQLQEVFNTFTVDDVVLVIRFDWLIIVYGNMLITKYRKLKHRAMIRSKLRRAGQVLIEMKKICPIVSDVASIFQPKCYDSFVAAARTIGRLDPITNYYGAPSTAAATVTETKEIGSIILSTDFDGREFLGEEEVSHLSDSEKVSAKKYSRMVIQGKKGRNVPALIKPHIEKCLDLIRSYRKEANIPDENEFLFALPPLLTNPIRIIDACKTVRKFSIECGAKDPESLRGTTMRKHMASMCIWNEADDNTVAEVADYMGHDEKIHRVNYRRNPKVRQIVKMSKLLEQAQGNCDDICSNDTEPEYAENVIVEPVESPVVTSKDKTNRKRKIDVTVSELRGNRNEREPKIKIKRQRWTMQEIAAVEMAFHTYFLKKTLPPLPVIVQEKENNENLCNRTPNQIKSWISNKYKGNSQLD